jgi:hypothetical protein
MTPEDKLKKQIRDLFYSYSEVKVMVTRYPKNYSINVYVEGEGLGWSKESGGWLNGMLKLRDLLKVKELDMPSRYETEGCPTCGYGSVKTFEFHGWN